MRDKKFLKLLLLSTLAIISEGSQCGNVPIKSPSKLVLGSGSTVSYPGQWPWLAPIFNEKSYICGSSLISNKHVLTAAHCLSGMQPGEMYVLFGRYSLTNETEPNYEKRYIIQWYLHEDYQPTATSYQSKGDIAIMKLESLVKYTDFIQPVCLPKSGTIVDNREGYIAGYGYNSVTSYEDKPRHAPLHAINEHDCIYINADYVKILSKSSFCAKNVHEMSAPCKGDSGGGFYSKNIENPASFTINGIVSHATSEHCILKDYTVFTDVAKYLDWINQKMRDQSEFKIGSCHPSRCRQNEDCITVNGIKTCRCKKNYRGKSPNCHECDIDRHCKSDETCQNEVCVNADVVNRFEDRDPCSETSCGPFAECHNKNGHAHCTCQSNFYGQHPNCRQFECEKEDHCPSNKVCSSKDQVCVSPCDLEVCGDNAICIPTYGRYFNCRCKPGYDGDAKVKCYITATTAAPSKPDPCNPSPCGEYSQCKNNHGAASCSCLPNHFGSPPNCRFSECNDDSHCAKPKKCDKNYRCVDPCSPNPCGSNANCRAAGADSYYCDCRIGYEGDAYSGCRSTTTRARTTTRTWRQPVTTTRPATRPPPPPPKVTTTTQKAIASTEQDTTTYCWTEFCKAQPAKCKEGNTKCTCEQKNKDCHCNCTTVTVEYDRGGSTTYKKTFQWFLEW